MKMLRALALAALAMTTVARAQTPPAAAPAPAAEPAVAAAQAPAPAVSGTVGKVTYDFSGWFVLQSAYNTGAFNGAAPADQPRWVVPTSLSLYEYAAEDQFTMNVRLSRFRTNIGIPTDGYLAGAETKALLEWDFAGSRGGTYDVVIPRLRHGYFTVTWKELGDLQLLVGQTWGIVPGPYFPLTITHLAVPRFGAAGILFKRAPQIRVSGNLAVGSGVGLTYTAGVLENDAGGSSDAGERSAGPMVEARIAANYKKGGKQMAEVGVFGGVGAQRYATFDTISATTTTTSANLPKNKDVTTQVVGVDAKIDLPYVSILGQWFMGQALGGYNPVAASVRKTVDPQNASRINNIDAVKTTGWFAQGVVTPMKGLQLVGGYGQETPDRANYTKPGTDLFGGSANITRNEQISGAGIFNVTSRWRVSLEYTSYATTYYKQGAYLNGASKHTYHGDQLEVGSLLAF